MFSKCSPKSSLNKPPLPVLQSKKTYVPNLPKNKDINGFSIDIRNSDSDIAEVLKTKLKRVSRSPKQSLDQICN
jgi:hypothetical protein